MFFNWPAVKTCCFLQSPVNHPTGGTSPISIARSVNSDSVSEKAERCLSIEVGCHQSLFSSKIRGWRMQKKWACDRDVRAWRASGDSASSKDGGTCRSRHRRSHIAFLFASFHAYIRAKEKYFWEILADWISLSREKLNLVTTNQR